MHVFTPECQEPPLPQSFRFVTELARGGMARISVVRDLRSGRLVALKTPLHGRDTNIRSIRREALLLAELDHPHIVRIIDSAPDSQLPWLAMPLLRGITLRSVLHRDRSTALTRTAVTLPRAAAAPSGPCAGHGAVPTLATGASPAPIRRSGRWTRNHRGRVAIIGQLLDALSFLHSCGIAHGDVTPGNVMVVRGRATLIDFGLAARLSEATTCPRGGTVHYLAPERVLGGPASAHADVYAAGCVLYEALTNRPPFNGQDTNVLSQHLACTPVAPRQLVRGTPSALETLVLAMMSKDASARPTSHDAYRELARSIGGASERRTHPMT